VSAFEAALLAASGAASHTSRLKTLLAAALDHGRSELQNARSGYEEPVTVVVASGLIAAAPVSAALRADAQAAGEREWVLVAELVAALAQASDAPAPVRPEDLALRAGDLGGHLVLHLPGGGDPELAALAFDEGVAGVDRLRARALAVPAALLADTDDLRPTTGPLRVAEAVARLGGDPADPGATEPLEALLSTLLGDSAAPIRPHEDPDPGRRVARRILQRLAGMGKWGGYHTEFAHLPRGFVGNDRALAMEVGEALLAAGLLCEKPSVGQRHVYLDPRRAGDIQRMIDTGEVPDGLTLPFS